MPTQQETFDRLITLPEPQEMAEWSKLSTSDRVAYIKYCDQRLHSQTNLDHFFTEKSS